MTNGRTPWELSASDLPNPEDGELAGVAHVVITPRESQDWSGDSLGEPTEPEMPAYGVQTTNRGSWPDPYEQAKLAERRARDVERARRGSPLVRLSRAAIWFGAIAAFGSALFVAGRFSGEFGSSTPTAHVWVQPTPGNSPTATATAKSTPTTKHTPPTPTTPANPTPTPKPQPPTPTPNHGPFPILATQNMPDDNINAGDTVFGTCTTSTTVHLADGHVEPRPDFDANSLKPLPDCSAASTSSSQAAALAMAASGVGGPIDMWRYGF